ncbi:MAG: hypothetical protein SWN10_10480 [Pseudomonadota bacterium]|nr:hypothetical protein [Alteromonas sp.]MDY6927510.1 hypothetical protein [Pseudomonadota bacterium]|tara:strand:- start:1460 stop:1744 length:285 start_codon:yes stop_codon:yes gene_type:complete
MAKSKLIMLAVAVLLLAGCADQMTFEEAQQADKVGFLHGLWHGLIIIFSWLASLIFDDVAIYAIYNNGGWYDFGFVLGVGGLSFSSGLFNSSES